MALDSLEKRRNVPGVGRPYMRVKHPVATPDEQWRIASGNAYGGNALTPAAAGASADIIIVGGRNSVAKRIMDKYYIKL